MRSNKSSKAFDENVFILANAKDFIDDLHVLFKKRVCEHLQISITTFYRRALILTEEQKKDYRRKLLTPSDQDGVYEVFNALSQEFADFAKYIKPQRGRRK